MVRNLHRPRRPETRGEKTWRLLAPNSFSIYRNQPSGISFAKTEGEAVRHHTPNPPAPQQSSDTATRAAIIAVVVFLLMTDAQGCFPLLRSLSCSVNAPPLARPVAV